mgnify:CR=1 FL=1
MSWQDIIKTPVGHGWSKQLIVDDQMKKIVDELGLPKEDKDGPFNYKGDVSDFKLDVSADGKDTYFSITVKHSGVIKIIDTDSNNVVHTFTPDKIRIAEDTSISFEIGGGEAEVELDYVIVGIENDGVLVIEILNVNY